MKKMGAFALLAMLALTVAPGVSAADADDDERQNAMVCALEGGADQAGDTEDYLDDLDTLNVLSYDTYTVNYGGDTLGNALYVAFCSITLAQE